jgi:hypothetical protein
MADNIVGNLFGIDMQSMQDALDAKAQAENLAIAKLDPYQAQRYYAGETGRAIGKGVNSLFGLEDPMIIKQRKENEVLQQVQSSLSPEDLQDPVKLSQAVFQAAQQAGLPDLANHAYNGLQQGRLQNAKVGQEVAQTQKAQMDIALKQQDYLQQVKAQEAISQLWKAKEALGETPTNEEIIGVAAQYMPAEKLATLMQTSADKAAYRQSMLDQAQIAAEARVQAAKDRNASAKELEQIRLDNRKELVVLAASLKPKDSGSKSSVYERGYANNFVTSSAELVPATGNLNILTNGGTSPITAGVFTNLKGTGLLSATGAAFGTSVTSAEAGQYESIMLPVIANIATMQNAGRRTTQAQVENLKNALIAKPGQPYIVQVQKMGELRQIVEAASDAAKTNPAMSEDQLAAIQGNVERVKQAIPFTGADVAKFSMFAKKNPGVKFVDWLKVNGEDKEAFGSSAIPKGAIDKLKANPKLAADFDAKFGAGASKQYIGDK